MAVNARLDAVDCLDGTARSALFALLQQHFEGVDAAGFAADLAGKTHVLRLFAAAGAGDGLVGFTTLDYRRRLVGGAPAALLYSGDTIVDPSAWAEASLGGVWMAAVLALHEGAGPQVPLWWLVLTSGVRTHRYLSAFACRYAPAPADRLDADAAGLLPELVRERFGADYDAGAGVVRFARPQRLRAHLAGIPPHYRDDAAVQAFLAANPRHAEGDELPSLCRLEASNFTPAGRFASCARGTRALAVVAG